MKTFLRLPAKKHYQQKKASEATPSQNKNRLFKIGNKLKMRLPTYRFPVT
jgi:hypothetical protein